MTYRISKDFHFSASHQLEGLRDGHPCGRVHGHNYVVRVTVVSGHLDDVGFVLDYGELAPFSRHIDEVYDHRHLNFAMDGNPTAENLARHLHAAAGFVLGARLRPGMALEVAVSETPKTWASFSGPLQVASELVTP